MATNANAQDTAYYAGVGVGTINTEHKAAGVDYKLNNNLSVGADWVQYMLPVSMKSGTVFAADSKARMWGITTNVAYHF